MSEIVIGGSRYDDIYRKAYWVKYELTKPKKYFDLESAVDSYSSFLQERQNNRTLADIAYAETLRKNPIKNKSVYYENLSKLKNKMSDDYLFIEAKKFNKNNYPQTSKIRNQLINNNRFRFYEVLPKMSGMKKLVMKIKAMI